MLEDELRMLTACKSALHDEGASSLERIDFSKLTTAQLVALNEKFEAEFSRKTQELRKQLKDIHERPLVEPLTMKISEYPQLTRGVLESIPTVNAGDTLVTFTNARRPKKDNFVLSWEVGPELDGRMSRLEITPFPLQLRKSSRILDAAPFFDVDAKEKAGFSRALREANRWCMTQIVERSRFWQVGFLEELVEMTGVFRATPKQERNH